MKKNTVLTLIVMALVLSMAAQPAQAVGVPAWYNTSKNIYPIQYQAWDAMDASRFDAISDGVTVLDGADFLTTPGMILQVSGRCFLEHNPFLFYARLAIWYDQNVIPVTHPLVFTNDRTVTFAYTFYAGSRLQFQLYTDGSTPVNNIRCNLLFEEIE